MPTLKRLLEDWAPSVVLALVAGHELLYNHASLGTWLLAQSLVWLLVLRRRLPAVVLALTLVLAMAGWLADQASVSQLGVLVALHGLASRRPRPLALGAAALVEVGAILFSIRFAPSGSVNDALVLLTGLVVSAVLLGTTQGVQQAYLLALRDRAAQLERDREQQALLAAAEERSRIAREMHDIVAHSVSVMIALSEGAAATPSSEESRGAMRQVAATGREALDELRRVLSVLHLPDAEERAPQPTLSALPRLADDVRRAGLDVSLDVDPIASELPAALQTTAYRIVQESLTNTLKHASGAAHSSVVVAVREHEVGIEVRDDGRPSSTVVAVAGNGIRGMRERAGLFGGSVSAAPEAAGWVVTCVLDRP